VDIGKRLRELREAKGLSQRDIEDRTGLNRAYVSKSECGRGTPTLQVLERWANALDVDMSHLFAAKDGEAEPPALPGRMPLGAQELTLLGLFGQSKPEGSSSAAL